MECENRSEGVNERNRNVQFELHDDTFREYIVEEKKHEISRIFGMD